MPYSSIAELPPEVKDRYSPRCQRVFMDAYNNAAERDMDEEARMKVAHTAAGMCKDAGKALKAEWDTAYINDLPDSAFACIDSGGDKDEGGKTVPRSKRHYPHHRADGSLDLPHLRNALARARQAGTASCGVSHLEAHAEAEGVGKSAKESAMPVMAVKFVNEDVIEGPGIPFGGPIQGKDIDGEDFGPDTDFCLEWFGEAGRPLLYHHGLDDNLKTAVVGRQIGLEVHDDGVWVKAQLDKNSRYHKVVSELIEKGALGYSSGAMPHLVTKTANGHITRWPWVEISLTPTPANPSAQVYAVKAADALEHLGAVDVNVPAPLQAALKALDEWADTRDATDSGSESFDDQGTRIATEIGAFLSRAQKRVAVRAVKVGRELSTTNRQWLQSLDERLAAIAELRREVQDILAKTDPQAAEAAKALDLELLMDELRRNGVAA